MKRLLILLLPIAVFSKTVNFQTALSLTLANNKELKAKKIAIESTRKQIAEADSYNKGTVTFGETISNTNHAGYVFGMKLSQRQADFGDFGFDQFISGMGTITPNSPTYDGGTSLLATEPDKLNNPDPVTNFETKLTYDVPIFVGYKLQTGKAMAQLQVLAKEAKYIHDEKALGIKVLQAYNGAVTAKNFIALTQKGKDKAEHFIKTATKMYEKKLTRIIDVKQAKMAYMSIDTKNKEAKSKYNMAIAYLRFLTADSTITDVGEYELFDYKLDNLKNLQDEAIENRDDYNWMNYNTQTMKKKIKYDSSDEYPTIGGHVEYGFNDDTVSVLDMDKDYYLLAVGLTYKLFDGGLVSIQKEKAKLDYQKTQDYFQLMENGIKLEVEKNFLELKTKDETLADKIKTGEMAEEILDETVKIYSNNLNFRTNMMYLLMSLENMMITQAEVITSEYEKTISSASLRLATGKSLKR